MEHSAYAETTPAELMQQHWPEVQELRLGYYAQMLGVQRGAAVANTEPLNWAYPNRTVGTELNRSRQRYAHRSVVVHDSASGLDAICTTADNVSSKRPWPIGSIERAAKLHVSELLPHRYRVIRELIAPDQAMTYVMAALALRECNDQPVSIHVWKGEEFLEELVDQTRFEQRSDPETLRLGQFTIEQTAYEAPNMNRLFIEILGIVGDKEIGRGLHQISMS